MRREKRATGLPAHAIDVTYPFHESDGQAARHLRILVRSDAMPGLQLTYQTLATSRNEAAIDLLLKTIDVGEAALRDQALLSLVRRDEPRCGEAILELWDRLSPDNVRLLREKKAWMSSPVLSGLENASMMARAIAAAEALQLDEAIAPLAMLAETGGTREVRGLAGRAVMALARPLGDQARADAAQPAVRGPIIARLVDSVRRFAMHRNPDLVDAYLLVSCWGDGDLRQMLGADTAENHTICARLRDHADPGLIDLVAGFIRRRNVPRQIAEIMIGRRDEAFRDALLRNIGAEPTATTLRNLRELPMPRCCEGGETIVAGIPADYRAALLHVYGASCSDPVRTLQIVTAAVVREGRGVLHAAAMVMTRLEPFDVDFWLRPATLVADGNDEAIARNGHAVLLKRLIDLLDHDDGGLVKATRRILASLHAESMLKQFQALRPRSRRRLGRVVMMIDAQAIDRVRDALRHPVLERRLDAIASADALALVDLLSDSFSRITREDHQQARIRAAEAMVHADGQVIESLLDEMVRLPDSPVRDAALAAREKRRRRPRKRTPSGPGNAR